MPRLTRVFMKQKWRHLQVLQRRGPELQRGGHQIKEIKVPPNKRGPPNKRVPSNKKAMDLPNMRAASAVV